MTLDQKHIEWCNVAAGFSRRLLTYISNCFPAIAGLVSYFGGILGYEYLADLWKTDRRRGLYWSIGIHVAPSWDSLLEQLTSRNKYRAPSWSWASRDQVRSFGQAYKSSFLDPYRISSSVGDYCRECESIEGRAAHAAPDRYLTDQVADGSLLVTAKMCSLSGPLETDDEYDDY